jgi:uncharacterized membrane protein
MKLTPEERKRIYEEEKARIEARETLEKEKRAEPGEGRSNLTPNVTGVLCYLGIWITGIIFYVLEQRNRWVRFHAAQSIVVFGGLGILWAILGWIPYLHWFFTAVIWITGIILWIILMSKAYNGERYKLPLAGDIAEMMIGIPIYVPNHAPPPPPKAGKKVPPPPPPQPARAGVAGGETAKTVEDFSKYRREGRITLSAFAIVGCIALLVLFNFFNEYIAYYTYHSATKTWSWQPFFTSDISAWLPVLNAALAVAIVANIVLIIVNNKIFQEAIRVVNGGFGLACVLTLLIVFPFDFNVIPNSDAAYWTTVGVRIFLILLSVGIGVGLLVRFIRLLINTIRFAD